MCELHLNKAVKNKVRYSVKSRDFRRLEKNVNDLESSLKRIEERAILVMLG